MPTTTPYDFGDVVLVPFPFTDQSAIKKRPAVIVSSPKYNNTKPDIIILPVTSQFRSELAFGEAIVQKWKEAGLIKPSVFKPLLSTLEKKLMIRKLGRLHEADRKTLEKLLKAIIGTSFVAE